MSKKTLAIGMIVLGVIIIAVGFGAYFLGLSPSQAIGWKKELLGGFGVLVALVGVGLMFWKKA